MRGWLAKRGRRHCGDGSRVSALKELVPVAIGVAEILARDGNSERRAVRQRGGLAAVQFGNHGAPEDRVRDAASLDACRRACALAIGFTQRIACCRSCLCVILMAWSTACLRRSGRGARCTSVAGSDLGIIMRTGGRGVRSFRRCVGLRHDVRSGRGRNNCRPFGKPMRRGAPLPKSGYDAFEAKYGVRIGQHLWSLRRLGR